MRSWCRSLHRALQSLPELSSPLRFRYRRGGRPRQAQTHLQSCRLRHTVRETQISAPRRGVSQTRSRLGSAGSYGFGLERYRMRSKNAPFQDRLTPQGQAGIAVSTPLLKGQFSAEAGGIGASTEPAPFPLVRFRVASKKRSLTRGCSGSSCVGINPCVQDHSWIGKCSAVEQVGNTESQAGA